MCVSRKVKRRKKKCDTCVFGRYLHTKMKPVSGHRQMPSKQLLTHGTSLISQPPCNTLFLSVATMNHYHHNSLCVYINFFRYVYFACISPLMAFKPQEAINSQLRTTYVSDEESLDTVGAHLWRREKVFVDG